MAVFERVARRLQDGEFDDGSAPARLHGDLWSGNIAWTPQGAVLIDPAAHGGHRETDLAMLALFGCPHWDFVVGGYLGQHRLDAQWQQRVALHQLHPLLVHARAVRRGLPAPCAGAGPPLPLIGQVQLIRR